jgi:hypothetical protein
MNHCWYTSFNNGSMQNRCWYLTLQIRDPCLSVWITSQNFVSLTRCRRWTATKKRLEHMLPPPGPRCRRRRQDPIVVVAVVSRPLHRHHRPHPRTSSTQPLWPLHRCRCSSTTEDLCVPVPCTSLAPPSTSRPHNHCHRPPADHPLLPFFFSGLHVRIVELQLTALCCIQHLRTIYW